MVAGSATTAHRREGKIITWLRKNQRVGHGDWLAPRRSTEYHGVPPRSSRSDLATAVVAGQARCAGRGCSGGRGTGALLDGWAEGRRGCGGLDLVGDGPRPREGEWGLDAATRCAGGSHPVARAQARSAGSMAPCLGDDRLRRRIESLRSRVQPAVVTLDGPNVAGKRTLAVRLERDLNDVVIERKRLLPGPAG